MAPGTVRFDGAVETVREGDGWRPLRLLAAQSALAPEPLRVMGSFASGVRMRLRTAARTLTLEVRVDRLVMAHREAPERTAEFLAEVDGEVVARASVEPTGLIREVRDAAWMAEPAPARRLVLELGGTGAEREVVVWFPVDAAVAVDGVTGDAAVAAAPARTGAHWVHHGSSISHGGAARDARGTWPALVGRELGIRWTNLGFGGNAQLDPMTALSIRALDADVVTLELGINVVAADAMRRRAFASAAHGFLDLLRDRMPEVPIVVIGAFTCPALEETPGPGRAGPDGRLVGTPQDDATALTLAASRELLAELVAARADPALGYLDGRELLGPDDAALLTDGLHPGQPGLDLIARRFLDRTRDPGTPLRRAFAGVAPARPAG
ncbi:GDSL-type esterase/lipase family protein [Protaetiibacter intestinalis]|uniref:Lipase n=1 Tax=Protaetiibacter intestinalis TaxID=2419774 RepID=A0A387B6L7_9MICO|nr:GDSL-type esterase/lipase family protein [Protaetiibacter intestinalis]AYF97977.1 lipase [Protaetiibacter intestinalis]